MAKKNKTPPTEGVTLFDDQPPAKKAKPDMAGPIQWIGFDETADQYHVFPEATAYLKTLTRPLAVVSVVGLYRTGKSYLLNRILDAKKEASFQVSPTVKSCTKGLWIMRPSLAQGDHDVLVVDTEGLGSLSASTNHDTRVFSLALLLSSMFLYNSSGAINETSLNNLSLVSSIAKHIHVSSDEKGGSLSDCFPRFLWVARDFSLQIVDDDGKPTDSTTYFNNALRVRANADPEEAKHKVRLAINDLFPTEKRDCVCMVRPCADEQKLQVLPDLSDSELRPEFVEALGRLKRLIFAKALPLTVPGQDMVITGPLLADLSQTYVDAINSNKVPVIRDSWSLLSETECARAADAARQAWRRAVQDLGDVRWKEAKAALDAARETVLRQYDAAAVGSYAKAAREALEEEIEAGVASALETVRVRSKERVRKELEAVQRRALREATTVDDLVQIFEKAVDEEEPDLWYPEAFPCLVRAIESFTTRLEKKMNDLQRRVDSADLEIAKAKAEGEARLSEAKKALDTAEQAREAAVESLEAAKREAEDARRRFEEKERQFTHDMDEARQNHEEMRQRMEVCLKEKATAKGEVDEKAAEESAKKIAEMTQNLIAKTTEHDHLKEMYEALEERCQSKEDEREALMMELAALTPLKTELDECRSRKEEVEAALKVAEGRLTSMEERHEEEAQSIQQEAMETVKAIRGVLAKERERSKAQLEQANATLADVREKAKEHADGLRQKCDQAEELARQQKNAMEESKRLAAKEREALRAEISRYADMFKEHQETSTAARKEWMAQLQDTQKLADDRERKLMADNSTIRKEADEARRTLEMENATVKAQMQGMERRRQGLEKELLQMRERLGKSESSGAAAVRLQAELGTVRDQKDRAQDQARALASKVEMLERSLKDVRRKCEQEKTKIAMQYERQISVLESKLM